MFVVAVTFDIKPGHEGQFSDLVRTQARNSLALEADCHQFDVCIDPQDHKRVFLYELYSNEDAFEAHLASEHFSAFSTKTEYMVEDKQVSTLQRIEP